MKIDTLLTPEQVASQLGISKATLNVWRCTGRYNLPFVKSGSRVRYKASDVDAFISRRTRNARNGEAA